MIYKISGIIALMLALSVFGAWKSTQPFAWNAPLTPPSRMYGGFERSGLHQALVGPRTTPHSSSGTTCETQLSWQNHLYGNAT